MCSPKALGVAIYPELQFYHQNDLLRSAKMNSVQRIKSLINSLKALHFLLKSHLTSHKSHAEIFLLLHETADLASPI